MQHLKEKMTCAFKNYIRNLANSHQSMFESLKIGTLMGALSSKRENVWA